MSNRVVTRIRGWTGRLKLSGKDGSVNPEIDDIRSEVGNYKACTTASSNQALYTLPTATPAKKLHITTLILRAAATATTLITLYDSTGTTTPTADFPLGVNEGAVITGIEGLIHSSYVQYQADKVGASVRFGGKLRDELPSE
jgi:hypothetical protein